VVSVEGHSQPSQPSPTSISPGYGTRYNRNPALRLDAKRTRSMHHNVILTINAKEVYLTMTPQSCGRYTVENLPHETKVNDQGSLPSPIFSPRPIKQWQTEVS
jgi:hypothetical protein